MSMTSQSTYVPVAPSPRLKETQTTAPQELVQLRVQHLLPTTTQLAKARVGKLKKLFTVPTEVMLRDHAAAVDETLQRLGIVKSVRNIKVHKGSSEEEMGMAGTLCLPFHVCAALPPWASSIPHYVKSTASTDHVSAALPCVLTGSVDGLLTLWDAEQCTPLCSQSTFSQGPGWGRVKSIAVYPAVVPTSTSISTSTTSTEMRQQCFAFTTSMFQREVRVWRVTKEDQQNEGEEPNQTALDDNEEAQAHTSAVVPSVSLQPLTTATTSNSRSGNDDTASRVGGLQQVAVDPTGALLAATHDSGLVHVWEARSVLEGSEKSKTTTTTTTPSLQCLYTQDGYETAGATLGIAFHPDGSLLTTTDAGGRVVAWDTRSGQLAFHTGGRVGGHLRAALCLAWSPCGVRLASGGADGVVHLYDARKLSKAGVGPHNDGASGAAPFQLLGHDDAVTSVSFYPNPFTSSIEGPSVLPLGVVTTSLDHTMQVWDADTGLCVRKLDAGMPLYSHCRPALQPLSDRFAAATAVMAVGHGKNWLLYDVGLRGEMPENAEGPSKLHQQQDDVGSIEVKDNNIVASAHGVTGGMKFSMVFSGGTRRTATDDRHSSSSEEEDDDEMMALMKTKGTKPATVPAPMTTSSSRAEVHKKNAPEGEESSEDEMEALKRQK